ncbi:hypothetical protein J437_LFUL010734 [Ladona fulva]|uniref:Glutathione peroxidase n=1 Tax=Ladona fulva TaxID=123851 RepID=A0A8K0P3S7_LADFU|nr:hypothetical protein J437_LFUL010734 [Ladona fulva]
MLLVYIVLLSCVKFSLTINNEIAEDFYSFVVKDIRGEDVPLEKFRGKVSLVVNVASECGYTDSHYKALKRLHDILSFHGKFNVLAFPCNQFGEQEPLENDQIEEFAVNEYGVEFPLFGKINVIGENSHPAFKYLVGG